MRIAITGGAGCLGSNLVEHWLAQENEILVVDNFATGKREVLPPTPGLTVLEGSVANRVFLERAFVDFAPELIVHSAAAYKDPADWEGDTATNVVGSINVARAAAASGAQRIVNFQTALCYGRPSRVPVPADHPVAPFTSYGVSKTAGEQFLLLGEVPVVSLRIANVTGPRLAIGPIPTFYKRLREGQECFCSDTARDFLAVEDFLAAVDAVSVLGAPCGVFNVSSGEAHSIREIFDIVVAHLGLPPRDVPVVPPAADDVSVLALDPSETERVFGWKARVSFGESIRGQLQWYDQHGVNDVYSHLKSKTWQVSA